MSFCGSGDSQAYNRPLDRMLVDLLLYSEVMKKLPVAELGRLGIYPKSTMSQRRGTLG